MAPKNNNSGKSESLWMEVYLPPFPTLEKNCVTDVCIVGSGIVGLTCAYNLVKQGKSVIVLDQGAIGGGQSARTTGHLTAILDDRYYNLEIFFGEEGARLASESHLKAIDYIEQIIREENIECDFERVDGYLFNPPEVSEDDLEKEYKAIKKTGMEVLKVPNAPFSTSFKTGPCLKFPRQAQFHSLKYLRGLTNAILKYGGQIFANTHVKAIQEDLTCVVKTQNKLKIESSAVIVATCTPVNDRYYIHTKQAPYRTYVIGTTVPKGSVPKALYWDTPDPYHYIRIQKHQTDPELDWLLIGGEDHRTGQEKEVESKYEILEKWARIRFPHVETFSYRWSGQVFEPVDSLAFIGRNPHDQNVYIATGDSGNGLTHGTIAGFLIPDLIMGKKNRWQKLYDPSRKTFSATKEYLEENFNTAIQYGDWLTPGESEKVQALAPEEGIILREGLKKIAVYKDRDNQIHFHSAFCPHLGGCVRWNDGEKSWDCPCHGSRFDGCGKVITGPAINNLSKIDKQNFDHKVF